MSDMGRKGLGDQVSDKLTPDSQKSTLDKASDTASGLGDKVAGAVQPDSQKSTTQKSTTQKMADSTRSGGDDAQKQGEGMLASAQQTLGNAAQAVSDTLQGKK
ncbi:hypothetical protein B0A49_13302 [Cryomyces minteri]|uniref:Uncharacterized protein n=1 Tax=Cryomyces minteri TaxID=331657 RepID=A0A4U0V7Q8_9PEZI|nr:hypothetical protein B0A49_13302 [Cryomyces minteri]